MKFTDKDLKRLKESIPNTPDPEGQKENLLALLHRLECAEEALLTSGQLRQLADWIVKHGDLTNSQLLTVEIIRQKADKAEAWRSSRGEE